jgi:hypothetical protein
MGAEPHFGRELWFRCIPPINTSLPNGSGVGRGPGKLSSVGLTMSLSGPTDTGEQTRNRGTLTTRTCHASGTPSAVLVDAEGKVATEVAVGAPATSRIAGANRTEA